MPTALKWSSLGSAVTVLSTELNSLSNDAHSGAGTEVDNATNRDMYGDFELDVTFASEPTDAGAIALFIVTALDGSNYQDGGSSVAPPETVWRGNFPVRPVTTAQKVHLHNVLLPPSKFKCVVRNQSGQAFPSSGSTLKLYTYNEEVQ